MKSAPANPKTARPLKAIPKESKSKNVATPQRTQEKPIDSPTSVSTDADTREEAAQYIDHVHRGIEEHQAIHEMVLALAELCVKHHGELTHEELKWDHILPAVMPGLRVVMEQLSEEDDDLKSDLRSAREKLTGKSEKDGAR